jgi:hypothetical protein
MVLSLPKHIGLDLDRQQLGWKDGCCCDKLARASQLLRQLGEGRSVVPVTDAAMPASRMRDF